MSKAENIVLIKCGDEIDSVLLDCTVGKCI